jgi:hypothetical protein
VSGKKSAAWLFWLLLAVGIVGGAVAIALLMGGKPKLEAAFGLSVNKGFAPVRVNFTNLTSGEFLGAFWNFGDGTTSTNGDPEHTFEQPGAYVVTLLVASEKEQSFATNVVTVIQPVKADFAASPDPGPAQREHRRPLERGRSGVAVGFREWEYIHQPDPAGPGLRDGGQLHDPTDRDRA